MIFICDVDDGLLNAVDPIILFEFCPEERVINMMMMMMISMMTIIIMIMMMMLIIMISINIITYLVFTMNDLAGDSTRKE
jgi:hypothetical protein